MTRHNIPSPAPQKPRGKRREEGGLSMKGKIRSRETTCPNSHGKLISAPEKGIFCSACDYRPKTFFIDIYSQGRHRISTDLDGYILDSYQRASRLLERMRSEVDSGTFKIANYAQAHIEEFRGRNLIPRWLVTKDTLAPSTVREYQRYARLYFLPYFGNFDMRKITPGKVEDFLYVWIPEQQLKCHKKNPVSFKKALSLKTLENI